ncbi:MAG: hypothetical protein AAF960_04945 [Bacteroidota bacterium]
MTNSKLITLLKTFDKLEWRRLGEFLASPFFNKNQELLNFYGYLKKITPDFSEKKLTKERVFKKIYPNQPFQARMIEDLMYSLLKQSENFLRLLQLEQNEYVSNLLILDGLIERKLEKHYRIYKKESAKILESNVGSSSDRLLFQYQLANLATKHFNAQNQRVNNPNQQLSLDLLDQFYFFNKLKASCEMLVNKDIVAEDFRLDFTQEVATYLAEKKEPLEPIIHLYLIAYQIGTDEKSDDYFTQLVKLLDEYDLTIPASEKKTLYLFAINYCVLQMKQNNQVEWYVNQCLDLYLKGIQQKFLYQNGYLSPWTFKNVVKLGFNLKKYDWTANFIDQHHTQLREEFQSDAYHYNLADLNYRRANYEAAQIHLMQVKFSDIFYNLGAKTMLIKLYFETGEEEALLSMIASFTIYLKRNKQIANNFRETYLNFTSLLFQLLKAKAHKLPLVMEKISQAEPLTDRRWLLKVGETLQKAQRR